MAGIERSNCAMLRFRARQNYSAPVELGPEVRRRNHTGTRKPGTTPRGRKKCSGRDITVGILQRVCGTVRETEIEELFD